MRDAENVAETDMDGWRGRTDAQEGHLLRATPLQSANAGPGEPLVDANSLFRQRVRGRRGAGAQALLGDLPPPAVLQIAGREVTIGEILEEDRQVPDVGSGRRGSARAPEGRRQAAGLATNDRCIGIADESFLIYSASAPGGTLPSGDMERQRKSWFQACAALLKQCGLVFLADGSDRGGIVRRDQLRA
jgi:hypothetical protein